MRGLSIGVFVCWVFMRSFVAPQDTSAGHWVHENIGLVKFGLFYPSESHKTVLVGTAEGVIASLNIKTGDINWRQVLPEGALDLLIIHQKYLLSISDGVTRLWQLRDGSLHWESKSFVSSSSCLSQKLQFAASLSSLDKQPSHNPPVSAAFIGETTDVVVLNDDILSRYSALGERQWKWDESEHLSVRGFSMNSITSKGYVVGYQTGFTSLTVWIFEDGFDEDLSRIDESDSSLLSTSTVEYELSVPLSQNNVLVLNNGFIVVIDPSGGHLQIIDLFSEKKKFLHDFITGSANVKLLPLKQTFDDSKPNSEGNREVHFVIQTRTKSSVISVSDSDGGDIRVESLKHLLNGVSSKSLSNDGVLYFGSAERRDESFLQISVSSTDRQEAIYTAELSQAEHGHVDQCFLNTFTKGGTAFRFLIVLSDRSLSLIQDGKLIWIREEALASLTDVQFMELPTDYEVDSDFDKFKEDIAFPSFQQRLQNQIQHLIEFITFRSPHHEGEIEHDKFGFNKLIIAATSSGKIYAMESIDGAIIWSNYIPQGVPKKMFVTRKHAFPNGPAEIAVYSSSFQENTLTRIDVLTGSTISQETLPSDILGFLLLPFTDSHHRHILLVVDTSLEVFTHPETSEALDIVKTHLSEIHFFVTKLEEGEIIGYRFSTSSLSGTINAQESWNVKFPLEIEQVCDVSQSQENDHIQSAVRKFGQNGEFVRKYLNANMLVVATENRPNSDVPQIVRTKKQTVNEPSINIYLIDTIKGAIIKKLNYPHARAPVNVIQWENIVVAQYWSTKDQPHKQFQNDVTVLELSLEDGQQDDVKFFSSHSAPPPVILDQSYSMPTAARVLGVTKTRMGITSRQLLVGSTTDQILSVDKAFLDPRRPEHPTAADTARGLVPYKMNLPFVSHQHTVSLNFTIPQLSHIETYNTLVESTSLVVGWGLDVFFCRVTPSKSFDMLNADFNYLLLIGTLTVVFGAITIVHFLVKRKELKAIWQ